MNDDRHDRPKPRPQPVLKAHDDREELRRLDVHLLSDVEASKGGTLGLAKIIAREPMGAAVEGEVLVVRMVVDWGPRVAARERVLVVGIRPGHPPRSVPIRRGQFDGIRDAFIAIDRTHTDEGV